MLSAVGDMELLQKLLFLFIAASLVKSNLSKTCQPPAGYTLEASVSKYYKAVEQPVTWQQAKDACNSDGTMLVELRTAEEHTAIRPIFGKSLLNPR